MAARFRPSMPRPRPPVPADETRNRAEVAHRVGALVDAAQHLVFDVEQSPPLSRRALPLFALVGALTAGLAFAGAHGLLVLGVHRPGPVGLVLAAIGRIAVFASPLTGLAPTKWYADRTGARLDLWSVVAIVAAGIAALTSLSLLLR